MIRRILIGSLLVPVALSCSGCIPVTMWKADTVLRVSRTDPQGADAVLMGFRSAEFGTHEGQLLFVAWGGFPSEHETWVFLYPLGTTAHPYPDYSRRLQIVCSDADTGGEPRDCRIMLSLQEGWPGHAKAGAPEERYGGRVPLTVHSKGRRTYADLSGIRLDRMDGEAGAVYVSGHVEADRTLRGVEEKIMNFDKRWREPPLCGNESDQVQPTSQPFVPPFRGNPPEADREDRRDIAISEDQSTMSASLAMSDENGAA